MKFEDLKPGYIFYSEPAKVGFVITKIKKVFTHEVYISQTLFTERNKSLTYLQRHIPRYSWDSRASGWERSIDSKNIDANKRFHSYIRIIFGEYVK